MVGIKVHGNNDWNNSIHPITDTSQTWSWLAGILQYHYCDYIISFQVKIFHSFLTLAWKLYFNTRRELLYLQAAIQCSILLLLGCSKKYPHPPPQRMGFWKFLREWGVKGPGNPGGMGGWAWKSLLPGSFRLIDNAIRTLSSVPLQHSQTLEIAEISCSPISHLT